MKKLRIELVNDPQFDYCTDYHCAGDCGLPHDSNELAAYLAHALDNFDYLARGDRRSTKDVADATRLAAKKKL